MKTEEYKKCKSKLKQILEESELIGGIRGKETNIDDHIIYEIKEKAPEYFQPESSNYNKVAEKTLIDFYNSGEIFEKPNGTKFRLLERFSVHSFRYFVSEGVD